MKTYADTSLLFSLYATDSNSAKADSWRQTNPVPLPALHRLELRNALSLALFQKRLIVAEVQSAWQGVENDLAAGILVPRGGLWHHVLTNAESLAAQHTPLVGCRTLDILHVTMAKLIGTSEFCTFDTRQATLAAKAGLRPITL